MHDLSFHIFKMMDGIWSLPAEMSYKPTHWASPSEPIELKPCSLELSLREMGRGHANYFHFHFIADWKGQASKTREKRLPFPSVLHVWLSSQVGMACT